MSDVSKADDWNAQRIGVEARSILEGASEVRPEDRLGYIKGRLGGLPTSVCNALEPLVLETEKIVRRETQNLREHLHTWEKVALFVFGGAFLVLMVLIAWVLPEPKPFQRNVFCTALSISAACIGAILPGLIYVEGKIWSIAIRATGAIAFGVFVALMCMHRG